MNLCLREIAENIGGRLFGEDIVINSISRDSRDIGENCLYVPLKGDKFDGHDFIQMACAEGAVAILTEKEGIYPVPYILVKDTRLALGDIARYYIKSLENLKVVAITGSVGKTTTKDIVASVLSRKFKTVKTQGNYNNDIGVPLTIFNIERDTEVAVIEMGMNHFDEIDYLSSIALPDIAIITNIGVSHIENLGSRDGILKAKCEVFNHMSEDSLKILNGDDDKLVTIARKYKNLCYCSMNEFAEVYASDVVEKGLNGISCVIHLDDNSVLVEVDIPIPGKHMVKNALFAAAVGRSLGLSAEEIKSGIECFHPTAMRMDIIEDEKYTIINDAYNANPQSMKAAIDVLISCKGVSCCILGDMFELGENSPKYHAEVGRYALSKGVDYLICIGDMCENMYEAAIAIGGGEVSYFKTIDEFFSAMERVLPKNANILVKASRGMHFEKVIDRLRSVKWWTVNFLMWFLLF